MQTFTQEFFITEISENWFNDSFNDQWQVQLLLVGILTSKFVMLPFTPTIDYAWTNLWRMLSSAISLQWNRTAPTDFFMPYKSSLFCLMAIP